MAIKSPPVDAGAPPSLLRLKMALKRFFFSVGAGADAAAEAGAAAGGGVALAGADIFTSSTCSATISS